MSFTTLVITDFDQIESEWAQLLTQAITNKIFLHPIYQKTWWETLGQGSLHIITVRSEQGKLVGLAPIFIHEHRAGFVGCKDVTDYLDFIVHRENQSEIYEVLVEQLLKLFDHFQVKDIEFCSLPESSPTLKFLPSLFKKYRPTATTTVTQQDVCPIIDLPSDFETYLQSLDRKQRHEIRRKMRKLDNEAEVHMRSVTTPEEAALAVETFIKLHQLSSQEKHDFWKDDHRKFFELLLPRLAEVGWIQLFFLELTRWRENMLDLPLPTEPVAAMLVFDYEGAYNLYNSGFDPVYGKLSTGQVLTTYTIQQAINQGRQTYDFLRGDEDYKFRLGGKPLLVMDLTISLGTD